MLVDRSRRFVAKQQDLEFYEHLLPQQHPLDDALRLIPWDSFTPLLESSYSSLWHGQWYDGYSIDISMDADSYLINESTGRASREVLGKRESQVPSVDDVLHGKRKKNPQTTDNGELRAGTIKTTNQAQTPSK